MEDSIFQVDLAGILKVLSDSLYSSWEVFVRELLQNANDAITARKQTGQEFTPNVRVQYFEQAAERVVIIKDNGVGLTAEEMKAFLSKIGASSKSKELFNRNNQDFIGQFGIGLLSCFMVSDQIIVDSKSAKDNTCTQWIGKTDGTYSLQPSPEPLLEIGTRVRLKIKDSIALNHDILNSLLAKYGDYLPVPITYSLNAGDEVDFQKQFPWEHNSQGYEALMLGNIFFHQQFHFYFPIQDSTGKTKGFAYVLPQPTHFGAVSSHRVYVKKMFIDEGSEKILPDWAFFVKAVINSDTLSTTASREDLYDNDELHKVREELGQSIKNFLKNLSENDPKALKVILGVHHQGLKALAVDDEDFCRFIKDWFTFRTTEGELTWGEIITKSKQILYVSDVDEFRQIAPIASANGRLVVNAGYVNDTPLMWRLAQFEKSILIQQIDAEYFGNILNDLDLEIYDRLRSKIFKLQELLLEFDVEIEVKKFDPETLPAMFYMSQDTVQKRDFQEIKDEVDDTWGSITESIIDFEQGFESKLFLNYNNAIIQKILTVEDVSQVEAYVQIIYFNALMMGHYPVSGKEMKRMNENILLLIDKSL